TRWSALGAGTDDRVLALALDPSGTLYAGGLFTFAGGVTANSVAKWDGTSWSALGAGMDDNVRALAVASGALHAGGDCSVAGRRPPCARRCRSLRAVAQPVVADGERGLRPARRGDRPRRRVRRRGPPGVVADRGRFSCRGAAPPDLGRARRIGPAGPAGDLRD